MRTRPIHFILSENAVTFRHLWTPNTNEARLASLVKEVGELASAVRDKHNHPIEVELIQIGGMVINRLRLSEEDLEGMLRVANHED